MTPYRERREAGFYDAPETPGAGGAAVEVPVPRTHAELDDLAAERGYVWSEDGLTVAQKRVELGV